MKSTYLQLHIRSFIPARVQGRTSEEKKSNPWKCKHYEAFLL